MHRFPDRVTCARLEAICIRITANLPSVPPPILITIYTEKPLQCDEQPGGCLKCAEKGFPCPGYDRTVDSFFHDETAHVTAKAKKSKARAVAARDARDALELSRVTKAMTERPMMLPIAPLIDQGISYFMVHYAMGIDQPPLTSKAYHQHLSTNGFHPLVSTTMTALGIAGVANLYCDSRLKQEAMRWYLNAIKMANASISSDTEMRKDSTLLAVNLLTTFEATFNDSSLSGWVNHVDGAALLVKSRGRNQFSTPAGRRLYLHTIGLLTMNCMGKGIQMPDYVRDLNDEIMGYLNTDDPRNAFFFLHMKTTDLRARIFNDPTIDIRDIIERALELDTIAESIFSNVGDEWQYETVSCPAGTPGVFGESYHVYPTHATAQTWNWVRYNRIYFHDIIRNCILAGLSTSPPILSGAKYLQQLGKSTQILQQVQSDIIASMPQFMHDTPKVVPRQGDTTILNIASSAVNTHSRAVHDSTNIQQAFFANFVKDDIPLPPSLMSNAKPSECLPVTRISGGYATLWALFVAGAMPTASSASQDFVLHCLGRVEREFGIMQAKVFGNALKIKRRLANQGESLFALAPQYLPPEMDEAPFEAFPDTLGKVSDKLD